MANKTYNTLTYESIIGDMNRFRSQGSNDDEYNKYGQPDNQFFKPLFHFWNGTVDSVFTNDDINHSGGLLAPTWEVDMSNSSYYNYDSAWSFLMNNGEYQRADMLKQFVSLLSNINIHSPWMFKTISGIDTLMDRANMGKEYIVPAEQKRISIACMPDTLDNKIGTLLDLYRGVVWNHRMKKEVVPINLRQFDMSILIFSSPIAELHHDNTTNSYAKIGTNNILNDNNYYTSYKIIELHDCEIDYNSIKSGYTNISNEVGGQREYTIEITYGDSYERRYNEFLGEIVGDVVSTDYMLTFDRNFDFNSYKDSPALTTGIDGITYKGSEKVDEYIKNSLESNKSKDTDLESLSGYPEQNTDTSFGANVINGITNVIKNDIDGQLSQLVLGNIYGLSLSNVGDTIEQAINGNLIYAANKATNNKLSNTNDSMVTNIDNKQDNIYNDTTSSIYKYKNSSLDNKTQLSSQNTYKQKSISNNL